MKYIPRASARGGGAIIITPEGRRRKNGRGAEERQLPSSCLDPGSLGTPTSAPAHGVAVPTAPLKPAVLVLPLALAVLLHLALVPLRVLLRHFLADGALAGLDGLPEPGQLGGHLFRAQLGVLAHDRLAVPLAEDQVGRGGALGPVRVLLALLARAPLGVAGDPQVFHGQARQAGQLSHRRDPVRCQRPLQVATRSCRSERSPRSYRSCASSSASRESAAGAAAPPPPPRAPMLPGAGAAI